MLCSIESLEEKVEDLRRSAHHLDTMTDGLGDDGEDEEDDN